MAGYDPQNVNVVVDGVTVTGFSEDSLINCERNEDRMIPYIGVKGEGTYSISNNNSGTITLTLQQESPTNKKLQSLASNKSEFALSVIDTNTNGFRAGGNRCILVKEAPIERSAEITEREWDIFVFDYTQVEV